ncbi:MAG: cephalosporin hydroxylase family protein [Alphaproteobacteria bacterium]|nr:cephalosporin hydroxylase family protein [Alphaproteobacteria bacterium]
MNKPPDDPAARFKKETRDSAAAYKDDAAWQELSRGWMERAFTRKYMYNYAWLGRPIIQLPADMIAFQEVVWETKPDLIIETGIAHGGSLILSASMLALLDYCEAAEKGSILDPRKPSRRVLGIDIDIRAHNRAAIGTHPLANRIDMIEGSSIAQETINKVKEIAAGFSRVMVCLDSHHTHDHVLAELEAYGPLISKGCYCIAFDTVIEDLPEGMFPDRAWSHGNNSKTAVHAWLEKQAENGGNPRFEIDRTLEQKLLLSACPDGFLRRIS